MAQPTGPPDREEQIREIIKERERFLRLVWRRGALGKAYVMMFLFALSAPFVFDLFVILFVWLSIWPYANTVTEQVAALALVFAALHAIAFAVRAWAGELWELAFLNRPPRRKRKKAG